MTDFKQLCSSCTHQACCTDFAAPLVFTEDIKDLKDIGKDSDEYLEEIIIQNKPVKRIKKKPNSNACTFWDEEKRMCSIYNKRPFECRMFPFDINPIDGKFYWIIFSCNPDSDWKWTEEYLTMMENDKSFPDILDNISLFADMIQKDVLDKEQEILYTVLREVSHS